MAKSDAPTFLEFCERIGAPLSPAQAALATVAFDGAPVPAEFADLFGLPAGTVVPASARRTHAWLCGRSSGKTRLSAYYILWRLLHADLSRLARGELAFGAVFSPTRELSGQMLRFARGALIGTRYERGIVADARESFDVKRPDGKTVRFSVLAAAKGGLGGRGRSLVAAALDEACFFAPETRGAVNDATVYGALPSRLMPGGAIIIASTPWTQEGLLHALWSKEFGAPKTALVCVAPTTRMRSDDAELLATVATERERSPHDAAREYDCEWLPTGAGNAFDLPSLERAVTDEDIPAPRFGDVVFIGGDLALVKDRTAFVAVRASDGGRSIEVVDAVEVTPPKGAALDLATMLREAADMAGRTRASREVRVDGHNFEAAQQIARDQGIKITLEKCAEGAAREQRFSRAIDLFRAGRVKIPRRFAWLAEQLSTIAATPRAGGGMAYTAPRRAGSHADAASAFLLACESAFDCFGYLEGISVARTSHVTTTVVGMMGALGPSAGGAPMSVYAQRDMAEALAAAGWLLGPPNSIEAAEAVAALEYAVKNGGSTVYDAGTFGGPYKG